MSAEWAADPGWGKWELNARLEWWWWWGVVTFGELPDDPPLVPFPPTGLELLDPEPFVPFVARKEGRCWDAYNRAAGYPAEDAELKGWWWWWWCPAAAAATAAAMNPDDKCPTPPPASEDGGEEEIVGEFASIPGFCFFHFVLRFWNQILTCVSVRRRERAKLSRSQTDRYLVVLNLFSSDTSCSYVKAVLALLGLPDFPSLLLILAPLLVPLDLLLLPFFFDPPQLFELLSWTFSSEDDLIKELFLLLSVVVEEVIGDPPDESGSTCLFEWLNSSNSNDLLAVKKLGVKKGWWEKSREIKN